MSAERRHRVGGKLAPLAPFRRSTPAGASDEANS
jgi:hypothetical protein